VTELITGIDIVADADPRCRRRKIAVAAKGYPLQGSRHRVPHQRRTPDHLRSQPRQAYQLHAPGGPGIRVDSHVYHGYYVPPHYDSMIGKLIAYGDTRDQAIARMRGALMKW